MKHYKKNQTHHIR